MLGPYFKRARHDNPKALVYLRDGEVAVSIIYEKDRMIAIEPGPALEESDLLVLDARLQKGVLTDVGRKVRRAIVFAAVPVAGCWRYRDRFQIVPAPDEAPMPPKPMGENPFVLEVSYADSHDSLIAMERASEALTEVNRLLAAFVPWIEPPQPRGHIEQQWAIPIGASQPVTQPIWTQKGYRLEGFVTAAEMLELAPGPALQLIDEQTLYARRGLSGGETFDLPRSIELMFDRYYELDAVRRERLLRWAYWINHSGLVAGISMSASYMAMIQAVEAVRPDVRGGPRCDACGRETGPGPTQQFIAFMDRYVPRQDGETEIERKKLYGLRSGLTHGGTLMEGDLYSGFDPFTPTWIDQRRTMDRAAVLARLAGINWLLAIGE